MEDKKKVIKEPKKKVNKEMKEKLKAIEFMKKRRAEKKKQKPNKFEDRVKDLVTILKRPTKPNQLFGKETPEIKHLLKEGVIKKVKKGVFELAKKND